jgi:hypothetical protein
MHYLKAPTFGRTQPRTIPSYHLDGMSAEGKLLLRGVAHPVGGAVVGVARTGDGLIVYQQRYVGLGKVGLPVGYGGRYDGGGVGCARAWGWAQAGDGRSGIGGKRLPVRGHVVRRVLTTQKNTAFE